MFFGFMRFISPMLPVGVKAEPQLIAMSPWSLSPCLAEGCLWCHHAAGSMCPHQLLSALLSPQQLTQNRTGGCSQELGANSDGGDPGLGAHGGLEEHRDRRHIEMGTTAGWEHEFGGDTGMGDV